MKVAILFSPLDTLHTFTVNGPRPKAVEDQRSAGSEESALREQLLVTRQRIEELRGAFKGLNQLLRTDQASGASVSRRASATSTADLGINAVATAATLQSDAEVNTTPTSFSTFGPDWPTSTAQATLDGVYDGSNGTDTLTFTVDKGGVHGTDNLRIKVYDSNSQQIDQLDIKKQDPIDQQYTLSNGIVLTLGSGELFAGESLTLDVYDSVGSAVNPDKPFDGTRADNPNLEYGFSVTAGSFDVNGITINVSASDTVNAVLNRITQSAAGVIATFDAATETVLLKQKTQGEFPTIVLSNDTSGFVQAMKLDGAVLVPGTDADPDKTLATVSQFASIQSGTITVEGVQISIDVNADSLNDVINRINTSGAAATASLSADSQRVTIVPSSSSAQLDLDSGTTGFFSAVGIADGSYKSTRVTVGMSRAHASQVADAVEEVSEAFNALFDDAGFGAAPSSVLALRRDAERAVAAAFDAPGPRFRTDFGVEFDFRFGGQEVFDLSSSDKQELLSALTTDVGNVNDLFLGPTSSTPSGLIARLNSVLAEADSDVVAQLGSSGRFVDLLV